MATGKGCGLTGCGVIAVGFVGVVVLVVVWSAISPSRPRPVAQTRPASPPAAPSSGNRTHDMLLAKSSLERNAIFDELLVGFTPRCDRVKDNFIRGIDHQKTAHWTVTCANGRMLSVGVYGNATGSTRIADCKVLKLAGVDCTKRF